MDLLVEETVLARKAYEVKQVRIIFPQEINNRDNFRFIISFQCKYFFIRGKQFKCDSLEPNIRCMSFVPLKASVKQFALLFDAAAFGR